MEKFIEGCIVVILVLLIYVIFRTEKFIGTVSDAIAAKKFNFENDAQGYSSADKFLKTLINT